MSDFEALNRQIIRCRRCPRLREWCATVAARKRRAFAAEDYWGKPVPNFGDKRAGLLVVGLAPAAHGANRTGRMFTGDRSGEWLYRALHKAGFASQPTAVSRDDGLTLHESAITAACHCAPPDNKPTRQELANCREWFEATVDLLQPRVFLALGNIGFRAVVDLARDRGWYEGKLPRFAHGARIELAGGRHLLASYHVSQQNTFTGRLTEGMLDDVFHAARQLLDAS
jgi:uracil-DNA glycosylase